MRGEAYYRRRCAMTSARSTPPRRAGAGASPRRRAPRCRVAEHHRQFLVPERGLQLGERRARRGENRGVAVPEIVETEILDLDFLRARSRRDGDTVQGRAPAVDRTHLLELAEHLDFRLGQGTDRGLFFFVLRTDTRAAANSTCAHLSRSNSACLLPSSARAHHGVQARVSAWQARSVGRAPRESGCDRASGSGRVRPSRCWRRCRQ